MVSLRNACIRLTNRYWLAQGLTLLLLGCPALAMRFEFDAEGRHARSRAHRTSVQPGKLRV